MGGEWPGRVRYGKTRRYGALEGGLGSEAHAGVPSLPASSGSTYCSKTCYASLRLKFSARPHSMSQGGLPFLSQAQLS